MALIKCKECNSDVSSKAESCPHCGFKLAKKPSGCSVILLIALVIFLITYIGGSCNRASVIQKAPVGVPAVPTATGDLTTTQSLPTITATTVIPTPIGSQWIYSKSEDPMGKSSTLFASVESTNFVEFSFPYTGPQRGTLTFRKHPRYGKDILFEIEKGQLLCPSYEGCSVLVRIDEDKPLEFPATPPSDHSTTTIFIKGHDKLIEKLQKAKRIRIAPNVYHEGGVTFEFDVSGFNKARYAKGE